MNGQIISTSALPGCDQHTAGDEDGLFRHLVLGGPAAHVGWGWGHRHIISMSGLPGRDQHAAGNRDGLL